MKLNIYIYTFLALSLNSASLFSMRLEKPKNNFLELPDELVEKILSSDLDLFKVSTVSKQFYKVISSILNIRWRHLKAQREALFIPQVIDEIESSFLSDSIYKKFEELVLSLIHLNGRPSSELVDEKANLINVELLLSIDNQVQIIQDENLEKSWLRLRSEIIRNVPESEDLLPSAKIKKSSSDALLGSHDVHEYTTLEEIRAWFSDSKNLYIILKVTELELDFLDLTCLPAELYCFSNLQELNLIGNHLKIINLSVYEKLKKLWISENFLTHIDLDSLLDLEWLDICRNDNLLKIDLRSLTGLTKLFCSGHQLEKLRMTVSQADQINIIVNFDE